MNLYKNIGIRKIRNLYRSQLVKNPNLNKFFRGKEELKIALSKFFPEGMAIDSREALDKWKDVDIFLKKGKLYEDGEILFKFPIVPSEINLSAGNEIEKINTMEGILNFVKDNGLKNISWSSFFPSKAYSFAKDGELSEWEYYEAIENLRVKKEPFELVITGTRINLQVVISDFSINTEGSGDINYSIEFQEFVYPETSKKVDELNYWKPKTINVPKTKLVTYSQKDGKPARDELLKAKHADYASGAISES